MIDSKFPPKFSHGYGLLIGVGNDLPITVEDATALFKLLVDPDYAAYPQEQFALLTEDGATCARILAAFDQLIEQTRKEPEATVIVYYSGHGGW